MILQRLDETRPPGTIVMGSRYRFFWVPIAQQADGPCCLPRAIS
jgi:hypothetical protein